MKFPQVILSICLVSSLAFTSCKPKLIPLAQPLKIENTLKTITLYPDSLSADSSQFLKLLEQLNAAIDSMGYPDAGYQVWKVENTDDLFYKFMVEGNWPDAETYDMILHHELYQSLPGMETPHGAGLRTRNHRLIKVVKTDP